METGSILCDNSLAIKRHISCKLCFPSNNFSCNCRKLYIIMRLYSIAICRAAKNENSIILCQETDLSGIMMGKQSLQEMCRFIARELSQRIDPVSMASLTHKNNYGHVYKQMDGLTVVVITDLEYPPRAAHGVIRDVFRTFGDEVKTSEWSQAQDDEIKFNKQLNQILQNYKQPKQDKIEQVQLEIENSKKIVIQSIDKILENMDKVDTLVEKSNDLSDTSRMFYKKKTKKIKLLYRIVN